MNYFNIKNIKKAEFGLGNPNNFISSVPPTPPAPPEVPPQVPQGNGGKSCPKCQAVMEFGDGSWYCESCNELFPGDPDACPECGSPGFSEWERDEVDAWGNAGHTTKPGNSESRVCNNCGHIEDKEWEDPRDDGDDQYEEDRDRRDLEDDRFAGNYFNLNKKAIVLRTKKEAQFSGDEEFGDDITSGLPNDFDNYNIDEKCQSCKQSKPDVEARNSYGMPAGKLCNECAYSKYRDQCGLIKNADGSYSDGQQGDPKELEDMGEQVEPEDRGFYGHAEGNDPGIDPVIPDLNAPKKPFTGRIIP